MSFYAEINLNRNKNGNKSTVDFEAIIRVCCKRNFDTKLLYYIFSIVYYVLLWIKLPASGKERIDALVRSHDCLTEGV